MAILFLLFGCPVFVPTRGLSEREEVGIHKLELRASS
jgi:hypothetical protein